MVVICQQDNEEEFKKNVKSEIKRAMQAARVEKKPHPDEVFTDVYDKLPPRLEKQREEMWALMNKYKDHYSPVLKHYES